MNANEILGVAPNASDEEIRAAYLRKVKEYPPERAPEEFEKIRDAWEKMRDPRKRVRALFQSDEAAAPLVALIDGVKAQRVFAGPKAWLEVLKSK